MFWCGSGYCPVQLFSFFVSGKWKNLVGKIEMLTFRCLSYIMFTIIMVINFPRIRRIYRISSSIFDFSLRFCRPLNLRVVHIVIGVIQKWSNANRFLLLTYHMQLDKTNAVLPVITITHHFDGYEPYIKNVQFGDKTGHCVCHRTRHFLIQRSNKVPK